MAATTATRVAGGQYLTFEIDRVQYAFDVAQAQTVLEHREVTRLPGMPEYMRGIIDFRGRSLPVIDLRRKLGLPGAEPETDFMIIVLDTQSDQQHLSVGVTADTVREVTQIEDAAIEEVPSIGTGIDTRFIYGIGKHDDRFVIILNPDRIFRDDELDAYAANASASRTATRDES